jgi:hypothetical protein
MPIQLNNDAATQQRGFFRLKPKSWLWKLTYPFAHRNFTTVGRTLYYPQGFIPTKRIIAHEQIHMAQQKEVGLLKFLFLYLFCAPLWRNPWRWKWEMEAYTLGSRYTKRQAANILQSKAYGWLRHDDST